MGGFVIALSMERWGLHKRIALAFLRLVGTGTGAMVGGFMFVTAFLSMWVSNTATTLMMVPIAVSVIELVSRGKGREGEIGQGSNFAVCMMLGIAYAASLGGVATLIGTPPNAFLAGYVEESLGREISFVDWMIVALPVTLLFLPATWLLLCRIVFPIRVKRVEGGEELIRSAYDELGPMKRGEWVTLVVFVAAALFWMFRKLLVRIPIGEMHPLAGLSDPGIAMAAALVLFLFPVDLKKGEFTMTWEEMRRLPWGILILFGGGLSLAAAIEVNGVGQFLAANVAGLRGVPGWVLTLSIVAMVIFLTELTSNLATVSTLVPLLAGLAIGLNLDPYILIVPAAMAASCAFMLPVATPPNAVVFSFGHVSIGQMVKAGFWLNLIGIVLVTALAYALVVPMLIG